MPYPTPQEIAERLANLYREEFGGKKRGKFCIFKEDLRNLAGRKQLEQSTLHRIGVKLFNEHELAFIDCGEWFGVMPAKTIWKVWRQYAP